MGKNTDPQMLSIVVLFCFFSKEERAHKISPHRSHSHQLKSEKFSQLAHKHNAKKQV